MQINKSISKFFDRGKDAYSFIGRKIAYDRRFMIVTAVDEKEYTIERNDVKIDGIRYSNPRLSAAFGKKKIPVRVDPENPYLVYADIGGMWIDCLATGFVEFRQLSELQRKVDAMCTRGVWSLRKKAKEAAMDAAGEKLLRVGARMHSDSSQNETISAMQKSRSLPSSSSVFAEIKRREKNSLNTKRWPK